MRAAVTALLLALSNPSFGQADVIGIYFDPAGTISEISTTTPNEYVEAWVVLQNLSAESGLFAFLELYPLERCRTNWFLLGLVDRSKRGYLLPAVGTFGYPTASVVDKYRSGEDELFCAFT